MIKIAALVAGIRDAWVGAGIPANQSQDHTNMTDGVADLPQVKTYFVSSNGDPSSKTQASTFGGGVQQEQVIIHADVYIRARSEVAADLSALYVYLDNMRESIKGQDTAAPFGQAGVSFKWRAERVAFEQAAPAQFYEGIRVILDFRLLE